jgi:hypothetical protein
MIVTWTRVLQRVRWAVPLVLVTVAAGPAARAVDGVIEINQATVDAAGGFPYTIDEPGSYRLTSDLTVPGTSTSGLRIVADDVALDLSGFTISGANSCTDSGSALTCDATSGGTGVSSTSGSRLVIRNGAVRGFGFRGVDLGGTENQVEEVVAVENGGDGIRIGGYGEVVDCISRRNARHGVLVESRSRVLRSTCAGNRWDGVNTSFFGVAVTSCVLSENGRSGADLRRSCLVIDNNIYSNEETGLDLETNCGYGRNVIADNNGTVSGAAVEIGTNTCDGDTACP